MVWFKVDDTLAFHHKTVAAGNAAMGLWVRAGSWCSQQLTDGYFPDHMLSTIGKPSEAARLVKAGLWDRLEDGWRFHEWEGRNPLREKVEDDREKNRIKVAEWREAKAERRNSNPVSNHVGNSVGNSVTNEFVTTPVTELVTSPPTRPDPTRLKEDVVKSSDQHPKQRANEPPPSTGPDEPSPTAALLNEWRLSFPTDKRPPSSLINGVGRQLRALLVDDEIPYAEVREGLFAWSKRTDLGPGVLPAIVHQIRNAPAINGKGRSQAETDRIFADAVAWAATQPEQKAIR